MKNISLCKTRYCSILIVFYWLLLSNSIYSQKNNTNDLSQYYDYDKILYTVIIPQPSDFKDSMLLNILYKFPNDIAVFNATPENLKKFGEFFAITNIEFELKDSSGIIRSRLFKKDTTFVSTFEEAKSKNTYINGIISSKVIDRKYKVRTVLYDENNNLIYENILDDINNNNYYNSLQISKPIFIEPALVNSQLTYKPCVLNGNIPFYFDENTKNSIDTSLIKIDNLPPHIYFSNNDNKLYHLINPMALFIYSYKNENEAITYKISKVANNEKKSIYNIPQYSWGDYPVNNGIITTYPNTQLSLNKYSIELKKYNNNDSFKLGICYFNLPYQTFAPGEYQLKIKRSSMPDTITTNFQVFWEDMPLSLRNSDYAVELMYYILNDDEYDAMKKGSRQEIFEKIINYWKLKDPTPNTVYNEAMTEYFKRADFSFFNYKTVTEKDGAKTDRGKINILYGKPEKISRSLDEKESREIWSYEKLKKEFIFVTTSAGVFKLKQINDIK